MSAFQTRLLLATDGSEDAVLAARAAVDLSRESGVELHVAHVWHLPVGAWPAIPDMYTEYYELVGEEVLAGQVENVKRLGGEATKTYLPCRTAIVDEILDLAEEIRADLVIMGSRGIGPLRRLALGSVSEGVAHHAHVPVLLLRGGEEAWPAKHVVIGNDGSEASREAGELASGMAKIIGADTTLLQVYPELPEVYEEGRKLDPRMTDDELSRAEEDLEHRADDLETLSGRRPRISIAVGDAAAEILETARNRNGASTLIAVGSRGLGAIKRLRLGSVSTKVLRAAEGPVLVCPHPEGGESEQ